MLTCSKRCFRFLILFFQALLEKFFSRFCSTFSLLSTPKLFSASFLVMKENLRLKFNQGNSRNLTKVIPDGLETKHVTR